MYRPVSSRWSFAIPYLLQDLRRDVVGTARPRSDVVEPLCHQIFCPCLIPHPLADRPVHDGASAGREPAFPPLDQLAARTQILVGLVERSHELADAFALSAYSHHHSSLPFPPTNSPPSQFP